MKDDEKKLTLYQPAIYQIRIPGELDAAWSDWAEGMVITFEQKEEGPPVTILTGALDQAALHSLLRRLYSLGLPLVSVICLECD